MFHISTRTTVLVASALLALSMLAGPAAAIPADGDSDAGPQIGPPGGLPDVVPDFVSEIHDTIQSFVDGGIDTLGDAVSGVAGAVPDGM